MTELKEYLQRTPESKAIYTDNELHPLLKGKVKATVCHEVEMDYRTHIEKQYWVLFINGKMIINSLKCPFPTPASLDKEIAKLMVEEYKSYYDFSDLNLELQGKCACKEYQGTYSKCDECHRYHYGAGEGKEDACIGATYNLPNHINFWNLETDLRNQYGPNTENYKRYLSVRASSLINLAWELLREDYSLKKKILKGIWGIKK